MAEKMIRNLLISLGILALLTPSARAAHRPPRNVPPTDEIEVLDPGAEDERAGQDRGDADRDRQQDAGKGHRAGKQAHQRR